MEGDGGASPFTGSMTPMQDSPFTNSGSVPSTSTCSPHFLLEIRETIKSS